MIPLEDSHLDILGKAQRGLGLSDAQLIEKSGLSAAELEAVREGATTSLSKLAGPLGLSASALVASAHKEWVPEPVELDGLAQFNTAFDDMTVNAYLVWDALTREAAVFDTGTDCTAILETLKSANLKLSAVFLTHTHDDHIADLDRLIEKTKVPFRVNRREPMEGAELFDEGQQYAVGSLRIETRLTCGHAVGGITYVVHGLGKPLAIVGDAIFAGSMGGGKISYTDALDTNRKNIFSLPGETILAPGHGPLTTVAAEKIHNPFFAA